MKELSQEKTAGICRGFSLLLHSGLSLADAAWLLSREETGAVSDLLAELARNLDQGMPLSDATESLAAFPGYVPGLIRVGEQTGRLEEALDALADYYDQNVRLTAQIRRSLAWPIMILLLMLVVMGVLLVKVLPIFDRVYASLGSGLTGVAGGLLALGQILKAAMPGLFALLAVLMTAGATLMWNQNLRQRAAAWYQRKFGDRGIARQFNNARFARGLSMAFSSGLTLEEGMTLSRQLLLGCPADGRVDASIKAMEAGASLAEALEQQQLLPPSACRMLAMGIRGGSGDRVMEDVSWRMMEEARQSLEEAAARVEPALVLVTSVLVGVVLLSAMLPLMNIMESIG